MRAVVRSDAFSAPTDLVDTTGVSVSNGRIQCTETGSTPEWALLRALMKAALVVETQLELVTFRDAGRAIDFGTEYVSLENLERMSEHITSQEVQVTGDKYILTIHVDV